ncbi:nuclear transport factor 2 family protein [Rhodococcus aetherivorans]
MTTENSTNNLADLADHIAVGQLLNQYTDALNATDWDVLASLFTEDAIWRVITNGEVEYVQEGGKNILAFLRDSTATTQAFVQMNHAPVIHLDGERASASSTMEAIYWFENGTRQQRFAMYYDEMIRGNDGKWRFTQREFRSKATVTFTE